MAKKDEELKVQVPGDIAAADIYDAGAPAVDDASAARIAELEAMLAQQSAMISQLNASVQATSTVPSVAAQDPASQPRIIGEDWVSKTSAEAAAAGVTKPVLCSDGYFVP